MRCPWWSRHEVLAVIKLAYTIEQRVFLSENLARLERQTQWENMLLLLKVS
jgi:hypothetical protein